MNLTRRELLKTAILAGATWPLADWHRLFAETPRVDGPVHFAAIRNGTREKMVDAGLEALGGIGRFVKRGQKVLLKPNIGWDVGPERGANTHPDLVAHVAKLCLGAGAAEVLVCDHTCDEWTRTYASSGIKEAVEAVGGRMVSGKDPGMYADFEIPNALKLAAGKVHELLTGSDVVINLPVLKHHSGARMTGGMKNLMGMVKDRGFWHKNDLQRCIAEFLHVRKPELTIIDAYHPMVKNGPRGKSEEDLVEMKAMIVSPDIVAGDAAAAKMLGYEPKAIGHIQHASDLGYGRMDLENLNIARIKLA